MIALRLLSLCFFAFLLIVNGESETYLSEETDDSIDNGDSACLQALDELTDDDVQLLNEMSLALHRNGESDACGVVRSSNDAMIQALHDINGCEIKQFDRYSNERYLFLFFFFLLGSVL